MNNWEFSSKIFLLISFLLISFFLNYISALYSEFDLFKVDLTQKFEEKKKLEKIIFVLKNCNLFFTIICLVQVFINWIVSFKIVDNLQLSLNENERKISALLLGLLSTLFTEILTKILTEHRLSKELATQSALVNIAYYTLKSFSFLSPLIKPQKKIFINSEKDIVRFVNNLTVENILEKEEAKLIQSALNFDELVVESILIPWNKVICLQESMNQEQVNKIYFEHFLTRYPVINENKEIIGVFNVKLYFWMKTIKDNLDWRDCIAEEVIYLSPQDRLDKSFNQIRSASCKLAVVKQEKNIVGIVTLQDILVTLVGKITDEKEKLLPTLN